MPELLGHDASGAPLYAPEPTVPVPVSLIDELRDHRRRRTDERMNTRQARKARAIAQRRIYDRQYILAKGMIGISAFVYNLAVSHGATPEEAEAVWADVATRQLITRGELDRLIRDDILPRVQAFDN